MNSMLLALGRRFHVDRRLLGDRYPPPATLLPKERNPANSSDDSLTPDLVEIHTVGADVSLEDETTSYVMRSS